MGPLDNLPNSRPEDPRELQNLLASMTQEIRNVQQNLTVQLTQEVARLQAEKTKLMDDITKLQSQQQQMVGRQMQSVNQRQIAQQQMWSKQLAQVLASHLQEDLSQRLKEILAATERQAITGAAPPQSFAPGPTQSNYSDDAYRLLSGLDSTLNATFKTLQQELSSYQSSLSQQLSRMHSLQQQGEVILETLVDRLISQLQEDATSINASAQNLVSQYQQRQGGQLQSPPVPPVAPPIAAPPQTAPAPAAQSAAAEGEPNLFVTGFMLVLFSSVTISFQNIVTRIILSKQTILGMVEIGGFISPSFNNSLLILAMRYSLVAPIMAFLIAPRIYPNTWRDIKQLWNPEKRGLLWTVVGSGFFLFISQCFIYIALGNAPTGVATAIFFIFPTVTVLLAWLVFGSRPSAILALAVATIYLGVFLTIPAERLTGGPGGGNFLLGAMTAAASGVTFAGYVILTQVSGMKKFHPAPYTVVNFTVTWVLAVLSLPLFPFTVKPENWGPLCGGAVVLFFTTLIGYVLNNFGITMIGAALASVVAATGPALTSLMALLFINEKLGLYQWLGVVLVTLWVLGINVENQNRKKRQTAPAGK